jgi:hypothetical protein
VAALFAALLLAACGPFPQDDVQRALYDDLRIIVQSHETTEWLIDEYEIQDLAPSVLQSVCQVEPAQRQALRAWLSGEIERQGGPAREAWEREGRELSAISRLLSLERTLLALDWADSVAQEKCPFYLLPDADFAGVHGNAARFVLLAESSGGGAMFIRDGTLRFGGGGAGRLLAGAGLDPSWTLAAGAEFGGGGAFALDDFDNPTLSATAFAALPVLLRFRDETVIYDLDLAPLSMLSTDSFEWPPAVRVAVGAGVVTPRIAGFMPTIVLQLGYEWHPPEDGGEPWHVLRVGTRIGVDLDF